MSKITLTFPAAAEALKQLLRRVTDIHRASSLGWSVMDRGKFMSFQSCITIPGYFFAGRVITRLGTMPSMLAGLASTLVENIYRGKDEEEH